MTNTQPVVKIKKSIHSIKQEILNLDIRVGVVSNTLLQAKMQEKVRPDEDLAYQLMGHQDLGLEDI